MINPSVYFDSFEKYFVALFFQMPFEPDRQQPSTLAQTSMDMARSSLCDFGLGYRLRLVDLATSFGY